MRDLEIHQHLGGAIGKVDYANPAPALAVVFIVVMFGLIQWSLLAVRR